MKNLFLLGLFFISLKSYAWEAPEILENACYEGCTPKMEEWYDDFLSHPAPLKFIPGMYSGDCYHLSSSLNPDVTHYIGMLVDTDKGRPFMAPILQFFGDGNSMADWSLAQARQEMSPDWAEAGRITFHPTSATAHVETKEGDPAMVYWARQNLETKEIYFLAYLSRFSIAFCQLHPNVDGLPLSVTPL